MSELVTAKAATLVPIGEGDVNEKRVIDGGETIDLDALGVPQWFRDDIDNDPWTSQFFERVGEPVVAARPRAKAKQGEPPAPPADPPALDPVAEAAARLAAEKKGAELS